MRLRFRIVLTLLTVVALIGLADVVSIRIQRGIERRVAALSPSSSGGWEAIDLVGRAVEIRGRWDDGAFLATGVESLPGGRRPKLRGAIASIDRGERTLSMYGLSITVDDETAFLDAAHEGEPGTLDELGPGRRVEVSCKVEDDGRWSARKIKTHGVKASDKVKGTVSRARATGDGAHIIEIDGLRVRMDAATATDNPTSPLVRMKHATRMTLAIQECRTSAQELLKEIYRRRGPSPEGEATATVGPDADRLQEVEEELRAGYADFVHYLDESRAAADSAIASAVRRADADDLADENEKIVLWLRPLDDLRPRFAEQVDAFLARATTDPDGAQRFLQSSLEPLLAEAILPLVHAYHLETEDELSDELRDVTTHAEAASRLALTAKIAGIFVALILGLVVSRSISGPIRALQEAARRIGRRDLGTRVVVRTKDEIGGLAQAFNRMAEELSESTVSIGHLNNVIDSMAGALFLLDADRRITSVNRAALELLGFDREELLGAPFSRVCPDEPAESTYEETTASGSAPPVERTFVRKGGTTLPVSYSGAALRDEGGTIHGLVCVAQDLTDRKRIEERIRRSLSEKELLLREVHHRVKHNLQVISSLLDLQSREITDPKALEKFQEGQDRIRSMSLIHEQLYATDDLEQIDFPIYLELLTAHLAQSYGKADHAIRIRTEVAAMSLKLDQALACGLIVNELVTNAYKHAFSGAEAGEIRIAARPEDADRCLLEVSDNGKGVAIDLEREGAGSLGMSLVQTLVRQLRGTMRVERRGGTAVRISFPVDHLGEVA